MRYLFENYVLDTELRELHRGAEAIPIAPQVFDLLEYLIRNRDRVVAKDELIESIWDGRAVSDSALTTRLNVLRNAIRDSGEDRRLLKTLPRKGFRFVGAIREDDGRRSLPAGDLAGEETGHTHALSGKPSIAVLPFTNMSAEADREFLGDGIAEDVLTELSKLRWLLVIARNSSFTYKDKAVDVRQVGRELGVRYVLEGSVRKAAGKIRITGQLIDAATGSHLWADRFDGSVDDIFELQDQVTSRVVNAIAPKVEQAEIERAKRKPTENLDAYDHFLRGMSILNQWTRESNLEATLTFRKAIELDPSFASAFGMAAWCYVWRKANGWLVDRDTEIAEAMRMARKAVELGRDDAVALARAAHVLAYVGGDLDSAAPALDRALLLNPNLSAAWNFAGWTRVLRGEPQDAIEYLARSMRLSPLDQLGYSAKGSTAHAHYFLGAYGDAAVWAEKAVQENPNYLIVNCIAAASYAFAGDQEKAAHFVRRMLQIDVRSSVSGIKALFPLRRPDDLAKYEEGLRKAGLPE